MTGTSGNAIARYNSTIVTLTWSITSGNQYATIDNTGAISIVSSGMIIVSATYSGYITVMKDMFKSCNVDIIPNWYDITTHDRKVSTDNSMMIEDVIL